MKTCPFGGQVTSSWVPVTVAGPPLGTRVPLPCSSSCPARGHWHRQLTLAEMDPTLPVRSSLRCFYDDLNGHISLHTITLCPAVHSSPVSALLFQSAASLAFGGSNTPKMHMEPCTFCSCAGDTMAKRLPDKNRARARPEDTRKIISVPSSAPGPWQGHSPASSPSPWVPANSLHSSLCSSAAHQLSPCPVGSCLLQGLSFWHSSLGEKSLSSSCWWQKWWDVGAVGWRNDKIRVIIPHPPVLGKIIDATRALAMGS